MVTPAVFTRSFSDPGTSTNTAASLSVGESAYGRLETSGDRDWYAVPLIAGETYVFRMLGVGFDALGDTHLRLRSESGTILAQNDDAGGDFTYNSAVTFTASGTGLHYLDAGAYDDAGDGYFLISAVEDTPAGVLLTADEVAWQLTNNFERYFSGAGDENISAEAYDVSAARRITYDTDGLTAAGRVLADAALGMWSDITGIAFSRVSNGAQIVINDNAGGTTAYNSNTPGPGHTIQSSNMQVTTGWLSYFGTGFDSYSFETYIHELGHALGLGHGGNYNGSANYGSDNYYLNDGMHLSIMSYMQSRGDEFSASSFNDYVDAEFRWMLTPAIADIIAMENLYGLSTTTRTGNTTYGYGSNTGNAVLDQLTSLNDAAGGNYVAFTLFDNGGTDTIDLSGFSGDQRIDLREGALSDVLGGRLNMGVAHGTVIERAVGGTGDDVLIGNDAANRLDGGPGADRMEGGAGNDTYVIDNPGDVVIEKAGGGFDTIEVSTNFTLISGVERLVLTGFGVSGYGNGSGNTLTGTGGNDVLRGLGGADTLRGEGGADTLWGGAGADRLEGDAGRDLVYYLDAAAGITLSLANPALNTGEAAGDTFYSVEDVTGTNHDDILSGLAGGRNNTLKGGGGDDVLKGYSGVDRLYGNAGNDTLEGGIGGDLLVGGTGMDTVSYAQAASGVVASLWNPGDNTSDAAGDRFYSIENIVGSAHDDRLEGNSSANRLTGGAGADAFVFRGSGAADTVTDFTVGLDNISLYSGSFAGLSVGSLAPGAFRASSSGRAFDASDRILYETDTGALRFDPDGTGAQAAEIFGYLDPGLALTASDVLIFA